MSISHSKQKKNLKFWQEQKTAAFIQKKIYQTPDKTINEAYFEGK